MPQYGGDCGYADEEQDGPRSEQETEKPQQQFHYKRPAPLPRVRERVHTANVRSGVIRPNLPPILIAIMSRRSVFCSN
jgi:hypothetical protein